MRTFFALAVAALAAGFVSTAADTAAAGDRPDYWICWTLTSGSSDCAKLPDDYRISGVKRPYCNNAKKCNPGTVSFTLTWSRIKCLSQYIDTETMRPTHTATIYTRVWTN